MIILSRKPFRFGPLALTATMTTNLLSPPDTTGGVGKPDSMCYRIALEHISVINKTATPRTFSLWLGAPNANVAGTEVIAQAVTVLPNDRFDWYGEVIIDTSEFLVGGASAATALTIMGEGTIDGYKGRPTIVVTHNTTPGGAENQPAGYRRAVIEVWGAGAGGSKAALPNGETGGGAGGYSKETVYINGGASWTVTVGTGGAGSTINGSLGTSGTASSVTGTSANSANGGSNAGTGGTATGGDVNTTGGNASGGIGGDSPNGGQGGQTSGAAGTAPGGGGAAGTSGPNGGQGGNGRVRFTYT